MKDLFKGIYSKYTGSTLETNLTGGLHNTKVPQDTNYPYAVFYLISNVPHWTFDSIMENALIQFTIYDSSSSVENISSLYSNLTNLYDDTELALDDYYSVYLKRESNSLENNADIWQYVINYRAELELK